MKRYLSELTHEQLGFLLPRSAVMDVLIFLLCLLFGVHWLHALCGLLLGTATMIVNMALLAYSAEHAVDRGSEKAGKRYMFSFYLIRFTIMGAAVAAGFLFEPFDPVCTYLPLLYPKLFYTLVGVKDHLRFRLGEKAKSKDKE